MDQRIDRSRYGREENMTRVIQDAFDRCAASGGGRVILAPGMYVCGTLRLQDRVVLWLERGAVILGSDNIEDYPENESCFTDAVGHVRGRALLYGYQKEGIGIGGPGMVDGRGYRFPEESPAHLIRPFLVRLVECRNVKILETSFVQAAAWCLHLQDCRDVQIQRAVIRSRCNGNNDGIDLDGCQNVTVEGCVIDSGDDAICLKSTSGNPCTSIRVADCTVTSRWAGFKIGTESVGDFADITVEKCRFFDVEGCAVKIVPVDGGNVENVTVRNVEMIACTGPVFISNGERLRRYLDQKREQPGRIRGILLERIHADVRKAKGGIYQGKPWGNADGGVVISGLPGNPVESVTIRQCRFSMPGGSKERRTTPVPEMGSQYPEFHLFDPLPAWALYRRYTKDFKIEDTEFTARERDVRPAAVKEEEDSHEV